MESLPNEERARILILLSEDEKKRDRARFVYSYDILKQHCIAPLSIWPMPNRDVLWVISGGAAYENIPYEDLNEVEKGMTFKDLLQFVVKHAGEEALCEARDEKCIKEKCPLFRKKEGICPEFKIAFRRG